MYLPYDVVQPTLECGVANPRMWCFQPHDVVEPSQERAEALVDGVSNPSMWCIRPLQCAKTLDCVVTNPRMWCTWGAAPAHRRTAPWYALHPTLGSAYQTSQYAVTLK